MAVQVSVLTFDTVAALTSETVLDPFLERRFPQRNSL
jgi:hypothetical protein